MGVAFCVLLCIKSGEPRHSLRGPRLLLVGRVIVGELPEEVCEQRLDIGFCGLWAGAEWSRVMLGRNLELVKLRCVF